MVRHYKMKGQKRKKGGEKYDKEGEEEQQQAEKIDTQMEEKEEEEKKVSYKKKQMEEEEEEEEEEEKIESPKKKVMKLDDKREEELGIELPGIPINVSNDQNNGNNNRNKPGVIFILEKASLEVAKVGKNYQLLSSDKHATFLKRNGRDAKDYRPDIAHQAILMVLDSTLNKNGRLKALYVKTQKGVLIEIKPHVRIPRTFDRFSGLMLQLLQKLSITAAGKREKLLRVIQNPVTQYLPINSRKIGFSRSSEKLINMQNYVAGVSKDVDLVFVVGAMAEGNIHPDYVEEFVSVSENPLSAAYCISRVCNAVEQVWKLL